MVEALLSSPNVDCQIKNSQNKTALELVPHLHLHPLLLTVVQLLHYHNSLRNVMESFFFFGQLGD